jgi:hypothetical protein
VTAKKPAKSVAADEVVETIDAPVAEAERGELIMPVTDGGAPIEMESVGSPGKVMRIGSMVKQLLDEVKSAPLDDASRRRMAEIYEESVDQLATALSPDLQAELRSLAHPFSDEVAPSDAELRIAQAQLVGWLEGLFHGIQATLFAQQLAARQQLEQMRGGPGQITQQAGPGSVQPDGRPGTYL